MLVNGEHRAARAFDGVGSGIFVLERSSGEAKQLFNIAPIGIADVVRNTFVAQAADSRCFVKVRAFWCGCRRWCGWRSGPTLLQCGHGRYRQQILLFSVGLLCVFLAGRERAQASHVASESHGLDFGDGGIVRLGVGVGVRQLLLEPGD